MTIRSATAIAALMVSGGMLCAVRCEEPTRIRVLDVGGQVPTPTPEPREPDETGFRRAKPQVLRLPPLDKRSMAVADDPAGRAETLEQAWATALMVDQRLEAERWELSAAHQSLESARSQRWPVIGIEGSYTGRSAEPAFRVDPGGFPLPTNAFQTAQGENAAFGAKADLPLYTSGRIEHGIEAAAADVTARTLGVRQSTRDLKLRVAEAYIVVLRAQRGIEVTESTVRSLRAHARNVELLFQHDRVPRNDLLAAQVALSSARQDAIRARNSLDAGRAVYNRCLGRPLTAEVRIVELPVEVGEEDVASLTAIALRRRLEIARLSAQIRALRQRAAGLEAQNRLQVALRGEYAFEENRYRSPEGIASVGVGASWNLFDGGRQRYQANALLHRAHSLSRILADHRRMIALEVRRAWLDVQETRRRLDVTPEACGRADENLRVARNRYALGAAINTEVLDAEILRTDAYRNHDNANYDAVLAVLRLRHATGGLGD